MISDGPPWPPGTWPPTGPLGEGVELGPGPKLGPLRTRPLPKVVDALFLLRPLRLKSGPRPPLFEPPLPPSTEAVLRLDVLPPGLASGLSIHQLDLPVPSFWTLTNLLCNDKLWRMEFCKEKYSLG